MKRSARQQGALVPSKPFLPNGSIALAFHAANSLAQRRPILRFLGPLPFVFLAVYVLATNRWMSPAATDTEIMGFNLRLNPSEFVDQVLLRFPSLFDATELGFVRTHLDEGDSFIDVGANIGLYSLVAAHAVGATGRVLAIEADPYTFDRLLYHVRVNRADTVVALNVGVADRKATLRFGLLPPPFRAASSFLADTSDGIDIACEPLLDLVERSGISRVKGVKIDIEGYEYAVLSKYLRDAKLSLLPDFIIVEFHPRLVRQAGGNVMELLRNYGYRTHQRGFVNQIMVRDSFAPKSISPS